MRGYFAGLARQSGMTIRPANRTTPPASAGQAPAVAAPLHVDSVVLVEPSNRSSEGSSTPGLPEKNNRETEVIYRLEGKQSSDETSVKQIGSSLADSFTAKSSDRLEGGARAPESETLRGSSSFLKVEKSVEPRGSEGLEEPSRAKGAVIRIEEPARDPQQSDPLAKVAHLSDSPGSPVPSDYMEGIREWLASSATENSRAVEADQFTDDSRRSVGPDLNREASREIQEFSLSIGSISIVVEEPAKQPVSTPVSPPALSSQSSGNQRPGRDAFALSRNYFRGF